MRISKGFGGGNDGYQYDNLPPEGSHLAVVLKAEDDISKAGNEMVVLDFGIEYEEDGIGKKGRVRNWVVATQPDRIRVMLESLAPECLEAFDSGGEFDFDPDGMVDASCMVTIFHDEWNGEKRAKVSTLSPASFD